MSPCRIALVCENAFPPADRRELGASGQSRHVEELAAALVASGQEATIWNRRDQPDCPSRSSTDTGPTDTGMTVHQVDTGTAANEVLHTFAAALHTTWQARPPHVAHAYSWRSGLATLAAARPLGVPVVQTFHGLGMPRPTNGSDAGTAAGLRAERHLAYAADRIIATSSQEQNQLLAIGAPRERIRIVPPGVDIDVFAPQGRVHPRGDRARLVVLGDLRRGSGVDEAIVTVTAVPDAELIVAGGGGVGDPDLAQVRYAWARAAYATTDVYTDLRADTSSEVTSARSAG